MSQKKVAYENPLVPNARLKQMYRAILRAHLLGQALPPSQRAMTAGREAALVNTALDLSARDLVLDAVAGPVIDFLRGVSLQRALRPGSKSSARIVVEGGSASRLAVISDPMARIQAAVGAAAALKAVAAQAKKEATSAHDSAVVVAYAFADEVEAKVWKSALAHSAQHDLPVIFVVLPSEAPQRTGQRAKGMDLRTIAHRAGVPAIPVDAADPVALYRVAQESIGHARIGGGPALIECVAFPTPPSSKPTAIAHIEEYILSRGIATRGWMEREASSFSTQIRRSKTASK